MNKNKWLIVHSGPPKLAKKSNSKAIKVVKKEYGLTGYEITGGKTMNVKKVTVDRNTAASNKHDVTLSLHGVFYTSTLSNPEQSYEKVRKYVKHAWDYGHKLGSIPTVVHPGGSYKGELKDQITLVANRLQRLKKEVGSLEHIYLETMGKVMEFGEFAELYLIAQIVGCRICVDWAHLYARRTASYGKFTKKDVRLIISALEKLSWSNYQHHHISGIIVNPKYGEYKHVGLEESDFPYRMVIEELMSSQLEGRLVVESGKAECEDAVLLSKLVESYRVF